MEENLRPQSGIRALLILATGALGLALAGCKLPGSIAMPPPPLTPDLAAELAAELPEPVAEDEFGMLGVSSENDTARFLAGLPGRGSAELAAARRSPEWQAHAQQMDAAFANARGRLNKISSWRGPALAGTFTGALFYPFSGPDFLHADAFFPRARTVILCGLEPVGTPPDVSAISRDSLGPALAGVRSSIATPLAYSYFITKEMRNDLAAGQFKGVTPILYIFLARSNHRVLAADPVSLNSAGQVVARSGAATGTAPGIRIRAANAGGGVRTIYYFRSDLSNGTLGSDKRFIAFVRGQNPSATFIKSASYLLHSGRFSVLRDAIEEISPTLLQDPSGIPYHRLASGRWHITLYGNYTGTLDMFKGNFQADLAAAYREADAEPMGFGVGYKWSVGESSLLVARKRRGEAGAER